MRISTGILMTLIAFTTAAAAVEKSNLLLSCEFVCNQSEECDVKTLDPSRTQDKYLKQARVQLSSETLELSQDINSFYKVEVASIGGGRFISTLTYKPTGVAGVSEFSQGYLSFYKRYYLTDHVGIKHPGLKRSQIEATLMCTIDLR